MSTTRIWNLVTFKHEVLASIAEPMLKLAFEAHVSDKPLVAIAAYETIMGFAERCKRETER